MQTGNTDQNNQTLPVAIILYSLKGILLYFQTFLKLHVEKFYKHSLLLSPVVVFLTLHSSSSKMRQWTGTWNESELMYLLFLLDNTSSSSQ